MVGITVWGATGIAFALFILRKYREYQWGYFQMKQKLHGKVIIITGGNSGIGLETARSVFNSGATVILACRSKAAAQKAIIDIKSTSASCGGELIFIELDLANLSSVRQCAKNILDKFPRIDILVNNGGVYLPKGVDMETTDGFEMHYGVNHLGHFLFTNLLLDRIKETPYSRIIIVSSMLYKQGKIIFDADSDVLPNSRTMNPLYANSKLSNVYHARELHKRLEGSSVSVFVLCPGFTYTNLFRHATEASGILKKICFLPVAFLFMRSSTQGAQTSIMCCADPTLSTMTFGLFRNCTSIELDSVALHDDIGTKLWKQSKIQCSR